MLREALALWRGPPLADLALEPFAQIRDRAPARRSGWPRIEARVEADLATGRHAELVGELQRLVAEHPPRERLAGQLMLALYRCGRQTEALEAYHDGATGARSPRSASSPGPSCARCRTAILRQDESLAAGADALAELPARARRCSVSAAGRPRSGARLACAIGWERARAGTGALIGLAGGRGAGKTRLAAELAGRAHAAHDAVIYASGAVVPTRVAARCAEPAKPRAPTLLVVDDADRAEGGLLDGLCELAAIGAPAHPHHRCRRRARSSASARPPCSSSRRSTCDAVARDRDAVRPRARVRRRARRVAARVPAAALPAGCTSSRASGRGNEAARRVGAVAGQAAAGREQMRSMQNELTGGVVQLQAADERLARAGKDTAPVVCPFKGLAVVRRRGRALLLRPRAAVAELVARLVGARLLGIVGPSGSGKSSVMRAGLLPALASGVLPGSDEWPQVLMRPGEHPLHELAKALADVGDEPRIVIAVDQFEETFTICEDEHERSAFIAELGAAAADPAGRYVVVIALRADFYGRCAAYPELSTPARRQPRARRLDAA